MCKTLHFTQRLDVTLVSLRHPLRHPLQLDETAGTDMSTMVLCRNPSCFDRT